MSLEEAQRLLGELKFNDIYIGDFVRALRSALEHGNRIWLAGNGGSASTVSHFASDLMNLGFDVLCLTDNVSRLTALTNDVCWDAVYVKQLDNFREHDILILISVHGGGDINETWSGNLLLAAVEAKKKGGKILSLIGSNGGRLKGLSDVFVIVPSESACYVEGLHSVITHLICERLKETRQE